MSEWKLIETAPKDGTFVLLFVPNERIETGPVTIGSYMRIEERAENGRFKKGVFYPADWSGWLGMDADTLPSWCDPTHWMPPPEPPRITPSQEPQQ